ncbi:hypothetical protein V2G26_020435 [Clonostachys chloroleuca]
MAATTTGPWLLPVEWLVRLLGGGPLAAVDAIAAQPASLSAGLVLPCAGPAVHSNGASLPCPADSIFLTLDCPIHPRPNEGNKTVAPSLLLVSILHHFIPWNRLPDFSKTETSQREKPAHSGKADAIDGHRQIPGRLIYLIATQTRKLTRLSSAFVSTQICLAPTHDTLP